MIWRIYDAFISDPLVVEKVVEDGIKFYEYPPTGDVSGLYIVIDPLDVPKPSDYADNKWLTKDYLYQIEIWSKVEADTKVVAEKIEKIMWEQFGFFQNGGIDEYDEDTGIYRDARRYRGKQYVI